MVRPKTIFYKIIPFSIFLFSVVLSCNRDSNQLPEPKVQNRVCQLYGKDMLEITFIPDSIVPYNKVNISIKNVSTEKLMGIKLLIELCSNNKEDYENCGRYIILERADTLKINQTWGITSTEKSILNSPTIINSYLISYNGGEFKPKTDTLSGIYLASDTQFTDTANNPKGFGTARGFIQADGKSIFRLKTADGALYNVLGTVNPDEKFVGTLYTSQNANHSLTSDPIKKDKIVWTLTTPIDGISKIDMTTK